MQQLIGSFYGSQLETEFVYCIKDFLHAETKPFRFRIKVQKWSKMTISAFFFKMLQKCSGYVQMVQNWSRTTLWVSEHVFPPPNMPRSHFWTFLKNRIFDLKTDFLALCLAEGWKNAFFSVGDSKKSKQVYCLRSSKDRKSNLVTISTILSGRFLISGLLFEKSIFQWPQSSAFT